MTEQTPHTPPPPPAAGTAPGGAPGPGAAAARPPAPAAPGSPGAGTPTAGTAGAGTAGTGTAGTGKTGKGTSRGGSGGRPGRRAGRPRGRPAGPRVGEGTPDTREEILTAAREAFAEHGYDKTSVRAIARGAGVDSALVHHYFGTKEQVFAAAVAAAVAPAVSAVHTIPENHPEAIGAQLVRFFLGIWENPETRGPLVAIARSALTNDTAARIFRGFITEQMVRRMAAKVGTPDAPLRVQLAASQLVGAAILRYILGVEPLASAPIEEVAARLVPVVQRHLTGPAPSAAEIAAAS